MQRPLTFLRRYEMQRAELKKAITFEVALVDAGRDTSAVADVLRREAGLRRPIPSTFKVGLPFVLFREQALASALDLSRRVAQVGGRIELRQVRKRTVGSSHSLDTTNVEAA